MSLCLRIALPAALALLLAGAAAQAPQIPWQRTFTDALELSRGSGRPLLICVNTDGEPFCDRLARSRYRDAELAGLIGRYVPVICSPDRHVPRDHDALGRRIPCPRFGEVTCGEHIAIEPQAHARFFKGNRVAPRHLAVDASGKELFDRFLDSSIGRIEAAIREHAPAAPAPLSAGGDATALLASRAAADRAALEAEYLARDAAGRAALLRAAASATTEPAGLLRLGLHERDPELRTLAGRALAAVAGQDSVGLLVSTLESVDDPALHAALDAALARLAATEIEARRARTVRAALAAASPVVDHDAWRRALAGAQPAAEATVDDEELPALDETIEQQLARLRANDRDGAALLALARAHVRYARNRLHNGKDPTFLLEDAERFAARALEVEPANAAAAALRAHGLHLLGRGDEAGPLAARALPALLANEAASPLAAALLDIFARGRVRDVYAPLAEDADWPAAAITDAHRAWGVLLAHPAGTAAQALAHARMLAFLGARRALGETLRAALARFPAAAELHEELRAHVIGQRGPAALLAAYADLLAPPANAADVAWFDGYAALIAAEALRRESDPAAADAAYARAGERLGAAASSRADYADSAFHYTVLAAAGRARLALDKGELERAQTLLLDGIRLRPQSWESTDGFDDTPRKIARALREKLGSEGAAALDAALRELGLPID
jgi:hypothetical protein